MRDLVTNTRDAITEEAQTKDTPRFDLTHFPQSDQIANTLSQLFPEQQHEDKAFKKAKEIMGEKYTDEEIRSMITSFEYLINDWLEEYEKKVFDKKTLRELLEDL